MGNYSEARKYKRVPAPPLAASIYYYLKHRSVVSPRAEVDITRNIAFGEKCLVGSYTKIRAREGVLRIGRRGGIANGCFISAGEGGIHIGLNFICGPNVSIIGHAHVHRAADKDPGEVGAVPHSIRIGDHVWIGAGSTITGGTVIGNNTIVVANSLLDRPYPDDVILQGNPARVIFKR